MKLTDFISRKAIVPKLKATNKRGVIQELVTVMKKAYDKEKINVSDVAYLTTFLFGGGPEPVPVFLAGDFNCSSSVNISDVTAMITYLFGGGDPPPCNPY